MALPPLIEALLRRSQYGVSKINARGQAIGQALQPFAGNVERYYAPLQAQEQAVGSAVSGSLTQQGQQLGSSITSSLQGIQAPQQAVSQFGAGTATTGAQAGAAVGALSSADLQRLHSQGTAEQIYAAALPRLAALAADQDRRAFLADAAQELADLSAQQAQVNVENQRYAAEQARQARLDRQDRYRYNVAQRQKRKADAFARKQQKIKNQQTARALNAAIGKDAASLAEKTWYDKQKADVARYNAMTSAQRASTAGQALQERIRHDKAMEALDKSKAKKKTAGTDVSYADIVASAKDIAKPTENAVTGLSERVPKAQARRRLRAEFPGATAKQIERALVAAGY